MEVRIRLGSGLARLAPGPLVTVELAEGATVADACGWLSQSYPELATLLRSALPVIQGAHVEQRRTLQHGDEIALLTPVSGG
jgi:molybdopterin synthase sulfur carrier subunit